MSESEFQLDVIEVAQRYNVAAFWVTDSTKQRQTSVGWPDLFLCGKYHFMWRELKLEYQGLSTPQVTWKYRLLATGANYGIWYPLDLKTGVIQSELSALNQL